MYYSVCQHGAGAMDMDYFGQIVHKLEILPDFYENCRLAALMLLNNILTRISPAEVRDLPMFKDTLVGCAIDAFLQNDLSYCGRIAVQATVVEASLQMGATAARAAIRRTTGPDAAAAPPNAQDFISQLKLCCGGREDLRTALQKLASHTDCCCLGATPDAVLLPGSNYTALKDTAAAHFRTGDLDAARRAYEAALDAVLPALAAPAVRAAPAQRAAVALEVARARANLSLIGPLTSRRAGTRRTRAAAPRFLRSATTARPRRRSRRRQRAPRPAPATAVQPPPPSAGAARRRSWSSRGGSRGVRCSRSGRVRQIWMHAAGVDDM
ncbi:hypothetical protein JKP88DRAFT_332733 [Tribonema minus]|uniref:Uncharacterized protein n=1 Tax=Tribonema minus TaxID=303371 RepID=A0A835YLR5_9STRA|nr:hypothetical protein JKP88DRAFT_332733 [Tribonema minus]